MKTTDHGDVTRRLNDLMARNAAYCGTCLRENVETDIDDGNGQITRICRPCHLDRQRRTAAASAAHPLILEWLRTRKEIIREHDDFLLSLGNGTDHGEDGDMAFRAGQEAEDALVQFLGGTHAARAVIDALDHHFASDYSEIHGYAPTLTFTDEFDQVLATGMDAFDRYTDTHIRDID